MNIKRIAKFLEEQNDNVIREVILNRAEKEEQIIYGARAINQQIPHYLHKKTQDYDILTKKPLKSAIKLAEELNRRVGKEEYSVVKALHKGTFKVKDTKGNTIADYTQLKGNIKTKKSWGNKYKDIKSIKKNVIISIKNPKNAFRREKDEDSLRRIKMSEHTFDF